MTISQINDDRIKSARFYGELLFSMADIDAESPDLDLDLELVHSASFLADRQQ